MYGKLFLKKSNYPKKDFIQNTERQKKRENLQAALALCGLAIHRFLEDLDIGDIVLAQ